MLSVQIACIHYNLYRYTTTEINPLNVLDNLELRGTFLSFRSTDTTALLFCPLFASWNKTHFIVNVEPYTLDYNWKNVQQASLFQEVLEAIMFVSKVLYCIFMYIVILNIISVNIGVHFVKWTVINCNTAVYDIVVQLKRRIFNYFVHCAIVCVVYGGNVCCIKYVCVCIKKSCFIFAILMLWVPYLP